VDNNSKKGSLNKKVSLSPTASYGSPLTYKREDGKEFHGYIVIPSFLLKQVEELDRNMSCNSLPTLILFHTAAGPRDIFLYWKADSLVTDKDLFPHSGSCVVFIADILSDGTGWAWDNNRSRYNQERDKVLSTTIENGNPIRINLRSTISSAIETIQALPFVSTTKIAAMGWCLGGHSILELGRMSRPNIHPLISYHGVFDPVSPEEFTFSNSAHNENTGINNDTNSVLICNGNKDPFVSTERFGKMSR